MKYHCIFISCRFTMSGPQKENYMKMHDSSVSRQITRNVTCCSNWQTMFHSYPANQDQKRWLNVGFQNYNFFYSIRFNIRNLKQQQQIRVKATSNVHYSRERWMLKKIWEKLWIDSCLFGNSNRDLHSKFWLLVKLSRFSTRARFSLILDQSGHSSLFLWNFG